MSDLISRQAAIQAIDDLPNCYNGYSDTYDKAYIIGVLEEVPTIDAVPVVRCHECKWWQQATANSGNCAMGFAPTAYADDFCSFGERREE